MEIMHNENKFSFLAKGLEIGFLSYGIVDNIMYINGTVVDPKYRNKGLAKDLVLSATKYAREKKLQVIPRCSYVVAMFDRGGFEDIDAR